VSTPEQKCISWPEQKYIGDAGKKAALTMSVLRNLAIVSMTP